MGTHDETEAIDGTEGAITSWGALLARLTPDFMVDFGGGGAGALEVFGGSARRAKPTRRALGAASAPRFGVDIFGGR